MASDGQIDVINRTGSILRRVKRSSSSSSSESSADDVLKDDTLKATNSGESIPGFEDEQNDVSRESSARSEVECGFPFPMSKSQVYVVTNGQHQMVMSPTSSPPVQVMDRSARYDSYGIPSSVFDRNANPVEWSIDSNESLFSIRLANHTFSRGHESLFSQVGRSDELTESVESNVSSQAPSVIVAETDSPRKIVEKEDMQTTYRPVEAFKTEERTSEAQYEAKNSPPAVSSDSSNVPGYSNGSGASAHSFAFSIKKRARPLCCCSDCSCAFCYHTWPGCKCSNCSWVFWNCWNCSHKRGCCLASPILTEAEKISPLKTDIPRQQSIKSVSEMTPSSTAIFLNWLQCFSWSCCAWGNCCRCRCACGNWFQCCSWSCCAWGNRRRCRCTCGNWFQCCSWSSCTWDNCCRCCTRDNCCRCF